jgi:hypothetical protein
MPEPSPYFRELAWKTVGVPLLTPDGREYHYDKGDRLYVIRPETHIGIYECTVDGIVTKITPDDTTDFDSHIRDGEIIKLTNGVDIREWSPTETYHFDDEVFRTGDYSRYYICQQVTLGPRPIFDIYVDGPYPINPNNTYPEIITSAFRNEGFYLVPRGSLADMDFVPKWAGMMYIATDIGAVFAYWDGNGPTQYFGWYLVAKIDEWLGTKVYSDGKTLEGSGTKPLPLRIKEAILDYNAADEPYKLGDCVYGTFNNIRGIFKRALDTFRMWQQFGPLPSQGMKHLILDTQLEASFGDLFYVNQLAAPYDAYNGIYKVTGDHGFPYHITISQTDISELTGMLSDSSLVQLTAPGGDCKPWVPGHEYHVNDMVYVDNDYSSLYSRLIEDTPETVQTTFSVTQLVEHWRLLSDATSGGTDWEDEIGMISGWIWSDPPDPLDPPLPPGFIRCDNTLIDKTKYARLFNIFGDRYKKSTDTDNTKFRTPYANNQVVFTGVK